MIKNANIYRIASDVPLNAADIEWQLAKRQFVECGPTQPASAGWAPPRGEEHSTLLIESGDHLLMKLVVERKSVPGDVLKRRVEAMAKAIEQETGRKPGRKQMKELKEQAVLDLLPSAFTKRSAHWVWIDKSTGILVIDASSVSKADDVITALTGTIESMAVLPLQTATSPVALMVEWLIDGEGTDGFSVDRECELKSCDEMKSVVRYGRHPLDIDEVREHIKQGKLPTRLASTFESRVSMVITDQLQLKRIDLLDVVFEKSAVGQADAFDSDVAITTAELAKLIKSLIDALGGEASAANSMLA